MGDPRRKLLCAAVAWLLLSGGLLGAPPRVVSDRFQLEMVASDPDIVTPIGVTFDSKGRLLVVESQTHQRPKEYMGPAADRIRMFADTDGDGKLDHWTTFAEGFYHAMNILARPDGAVYVVTRHNIVLLRDTNDDGVADKQDEILRLETKGDYPHNGLSGIAIDPSTNELVIGLGENMGMPYQLIGTDGSAVEGHDGAGGIFRCSLDGKSLTRVATGFWNPFSVCVLPDQRVFIVDNDPDASPPCRLVHVVPGGDYGFRYQYGRAGTHPLQAWNGELPGTLPMVCGVGEGPTAVVAHGGWLWVTSWGDHRIERYRLVPRGASYAAEREVVVQGDVDFRPTGMAIASDGSLYFGDWVLRDYPVHGRGRIWRLTLPKEDQTTSFPPRSEADLAASNDDGDIVANAASNDPFIHAHAVQQLLRHDKLDSKSSPSDRLRLAALEAQRLQGFKHPEPLLRAALQDESTDVRLFAVRWVADERIMVLRDDVAKLLTGPQPNARYYLALLATLDWLDSEPKLRGRDIADEILERELKNEARTAEAHSLALALISPDNKFLTLDRLRNYLAADQASLRLAAVRALAQQSNPERFELLATTAQDKSQSDEVRAEAIMGLAAAAETHRDLLQQFAQGDNDVLRGEAERVLRLARQQSASSEAKPPADDLAAWNERLKQPGDAAAGRRLFFSGVGARCGVCHQHDGHGGRVGPDLTHVGRSSSRDRIIASILQPSQEIAPHYQPWLLTTDDGKTHLGLRVVEGGNNDTEMYIDSAGQQFSLKCKSVESREVATKSIMPDGLESAVSIADLRDLVTFLMQSNDGGTL